jgi:hypothetical protein
VNTDGEYYVNYDEYGQHRLQNYLAEERQNRQRRIFVILEANEVNILADGHTDDVESKTNYHI